MRIKICGITSERDAHAAVEAGADALGFVFYPPSARAVSPLQAMSIARCLPPFVGRVGIFVNLPPAEIRTIRAQVGLTAIQLHGDEPPAAADALPGPVIKAFRGAVPCREVFEYRTAGYLLDGDAGERYGGAGLPADEAAAAALAGDPRFILAGGLNADNVGARIRRFRPAAVDVSSGVERAPGRKCPERMQAFVAAARAALAGDVALAA
ncbi:MAG: phosphoribosylanthranilate isomerase [Rhodospirillaceae bacterium]|nr:phosphoribosylanthranilate isomerase [Rhodospirillaceae bacterium]MCY4066310.1 phosphoribosylanthranilate isomerase [Rhodospirillaceae bacterium]